MQPENSSNTEYVSAPECIESLTDSVKRYAKYVAMRLDLIPATESKSALKDRCDAARTSISLGMVQEALKIRDFEEKAAFIESVESRLSVLYLAELERHGIDKLNNDRSKSIITHSFAQIWNVGLNHMIDTVQMWNESESTLAAENAKLRKQLDEMKQQKGPITLGNKTVRLGVNSVLRSPEH